MKQHSVCAVLLDRDGVINYDSPDYILSPEAWRPIPGSLEAITRLCREKIAVAIASNQSALGRGMLDQTTFQTIHAKMMLAIEKAGGRIAHTAYCPHAPEDDCECRKPKPGLVFEALKSLGLEECASKVVFIGDSVRDVQAAVAAGVRPMLVQTGYGDAVAIHVQARKLYPNIEVHPDLAAAVASVLE
jgi:D-glycero-D-manno-heptose 1,7-bisphosphate phosphatase